MTTNEQIKLLKMWNDAYRNGDPIVSDEQFEAELEDVRDKLTPAKFAQLLVDLGEEAGDVIHEYVMGSLSKIRYNMDELAKWLTVAKIKARLFVSAKIDGMSFAAYYSDGRLTRGATRGKDGITGVDITRQLRHILPTSIDCMDYMVIRGELSLTGDSHVKLGLKNRRNGTVGLIKASDTTVSSLKMVKAFCYQIMSSKNGIAKQFEQLEDMGFTTPEYYTIDIDKGVNVEVLEERLKEQLAEWKDTADYMIDGLVISDEKCTNEELYHPKNKVAFKVNSEGYATKIVDIEWNLSKTGALKPVCILEPTEIDGTTVSRANGCNAAMMLDKLTGVGAEVLVIKSGEIIPKIIGITKGVKPVLPTRCPSCGGKLTTKGVDLYCPEDCGTAATKKVASFVRDLGVEDVTEKSLAKWSIENFADLLEWSADLSSKAQVKFADSLIKNVFSKSPIELFSNMYFDGAGTTKIMKILEFWGDIATAEEHIKMSSCPVVPEGIGQKTIDKLRSDWFKNRDVLHSIILDNRYNYSEKKKTPQNEDLKASATKSLTGKSFLFTGTLTEPRKVFEKMVTDNGGSIASSVSKNLDYLVVGLDAGSKLAKAIKLGVETLNEKEFKRMI
jgi:DNA ligase (NAD+)